MTTTHLTNNQKDFILAFLNTSKNDVKMLKELYKYLDNELQLYNYYNDTILYHLNNISKLNLIDDLIQIRTQLHNLLCANDQIPYVGVPKYVYKFLKHYIEDPSEYNYNIVHYYMKNQPLYQFDGIYQHLNYFIEADKEKQIIQINKFIATYEIIYRIFSSNN